MDASYMSPEDQEHPPKVDLLQGLDRSPPATRPQRVTKSEISDVAQLRTITLRWAQFLSASDLPKADDAIAAWRFVRDVGFDAIVLLGGCHFNRPHTLTPVLPAHAKLGLEEILRWCDSDEGTRIAAERFEVSGEAESPMGGAERQPERSTERTPIRSETGQPPDTPASGSDQKTIAALLEALGAYEYSATRAKDFDARSTQAGAPVLGSLSAVLALNAKHHGDLASQQSLHVAEFPDMDRLRTACLAGGGQLDVATIKRLCAVAALRRQIAIDPILQLDVSDGVALIEDACFGDLTTIRPAADGKDAAAPINRESTDTSNAPLAALKPFAGGEMAFFKGRVELCGVNIFRNGQPEKQRAALELFRLQRNGCYLAYSGEDVGEQIGCKHVGSLVRGLRRRITRELARAGIACGDGDVIVGESSGYRFADSISVSVQDDAAMTLGGILARAATGVRSDEPVNTDDAPITEPVNSADEPVSEPLNEPVKKANNAQSELAAAAERRQEAILQLLGNGQKLRVPAIATALGYSKATVKREVATLVTARKIRFDGVPKTGGYVLTGPTVHHADSRTSRSATSTSAFGPSAESR